MFCSLTKRGIWWAMICTGLLVVACSSSATDEASKESRQVEEPTAEEAAGSPGTDYAAMVNGTPIMNTLLDEKMNMMKERYASMGIPMDEAKLSEIRQKMLNSLIE